jgi:hypothetical protein
MSRLSVTQLPDLRKPHDGRAELDLSQLAVPKIDQRLRLGPETCMEGGFRRLPMLAVWTPVRFPFGEAQTRFFCYGITGNVSCGAEITH